MRDEYKTKEHLMHELAESRLRVAELEALHSEHMQREEALKESDEALRGLINATRETLLLIDRKGTVLLANEIVAKRLGTTVRELVGSCVYDHFDPEVARMRKELLDRVFLTGEPAHFEDTRKGKSFETYGYPAFDKGGEISGLAIFAHEITARKQAETELLESEERYRVAIEHSNDGVTLLREDQHIYVNRRFLEILGYDSSEEIIGKTHSVVVHPDDLLMVMEYNRRRQRGEPAPSQYEFRAVRKDGKVIYVEISGAKTTYRGEPVTLAYLRDITERKEAEKDLKESEERYRLISENMMDVICLHDPDSRYVYVSPSSKTVLGYAPAEVLGKSPYDFFEPEERERVLAPSHHKVTHDKVPDVTVYRTRKKDGSSTWLETKVKPVLTPDGSLRYVLTASRDVTERKQAEEALRLSEEKFRNIFENAVMGIFQTTPDGKYLSANPAGARMYGYDSPEDMVQSVTDMFHQIYVDPGDRGKLKEILASKGYAERFEAEHYRKDGSKIWTSINARTVSDASGAVLYYETTAEDITERKRLESQLRQSQKMEAIGTLAGGIAHDFNNILTSLLGYASLAQMKMDKTSPLKLYVDQILSASEKATDLVQSLLAFSRKQPVTLAPLNINDVIKTTKKLLERLLTEDIELRTFLTKDDMIVMADKTQVDQILLNLVTNARDAMSKGGTLTIETGIVEMDSGFIRVHGFGKPGSYVQITVSDTGMGMDVATQEKIFDPFFTTKEVGKGTGLGLATVYGIVKQHNGYITVHSEPHQGTAFCIYLPRVRAIVDEEEQKTGSIKRGKETILIAEDNADVRGLMREVLQQYGYKTIEAIDGEDAIDKFKQHRDIDLVIIDSVMPKKNGREVYEEIHPMRPQVKTLFTSGYTKDIVLDKGIKDKEVDFITKPLSPAMLLQKVREVLDR
jgi:two-component system cell cycle sensor histidine kinase/response regulator CckA